MVIALGFEGSANKLGVGIIKDGVVLSNPRKTFISPPGEGFMPKETAQHHRENVLEVLKLALDQAKVSSTIQLAQIIQWELLDINRRY